MELSAVYVCMFVAPGPVNSLSAAGEGENFTSFSIMWTSPTSSEKNGIISSYSIVATFTSNGSVVTNMRMNVNETVEESVPYSTSLTGFGEATVYALCFLCVVYFVDVLFLFILLVLVS